MTRLLHAALRVLFWPVLRLVGLVAWLLGAAVRLAHRVVLVLAEVALRALALVLPLAVLLGILVGLYYMVLYVLDS